MGMWRFCGVLDIVGKGSVPGYKTQKGHSVIRGTIKRTRLNNADCEYTALEYKPKYINVNNNDTLIL